MYAVTGHDVNDDQAIGILKEIQVAHTNKQLATSAIGEYQKIKAEKEQHIPHLKQQHAYQYERKFLLKPSKHSATRPLLHNTKQDVDIRNMILAEENKTNDEIRIINTAIRDNEL